MAKSHSPRFVALAQDARTRVRECSIHDVKRRLDNGDRFHLVDIREESEWAAGRIPGAVHLGKGILERDVEARFPDTKAEIILYCGGRYRSALAADNLQKMGYENVSFMDGGVRGWFEAGLTIVKK